MTGCLVQPPATPRNWRVEKMNEDGGYDAVKVFTGPHAREQVICYAEQEFGKHDEIWLPRYPAAKPNPPLTDLSAAPPPAGQTTRRSRW